MPDLPRPVAVLAVALAGGSAVATMALVLSGPHGQSPPDPVRSDSTPTAVPAPAPVLVPISDPTPAASDIRDPLSAVGPAVTALTNAVSAAGGVAVTVRTSDGHRIAMTRSPAGDYRAVTGVPTEPEWLMVNGTLYARLGVAEKARHQEAFAYLGKPNATWTDAALPGPTVRQMLTAGSPADAAVDLLPLLDQVTVAANGTGGQTVTGTFAALRGSAIAVTYGLGVPQVPTPVPTSSRGSASPLTWEPVPSATPSTTPSVRVTGTATVTFDIDRTGMLCGYSVSVDSAAPGVTATVDALGKYAFTAPAANEVITLADVAQVSAVLAASASPVPVPAFPESAPSPTSTSRPRPQRS